MEKLLSLVFLFFMSIGCERNTPSAESENQVLGKWGPSYKQKVKLPDGTWSEWQTINTLVALPVIEFTSGGKILYNGKASTECCQYNQYSVNGNNLNLSDIVTCPTVKCSECQTWQFSTTSSELSLQTCNTIQLYTRL